MNRNGGEILDETAGEIQHPQGGSPSRKMGYALAVLATGLALFIKPAIGTLIESPPFLLYLCSSHDQFLVRRAGPGVAGDVSGDIGRRLLPSQAFEVKDLDILMVGLFVVEAVIISVLSEVRLSALRQSGELNRLKSQFLSIVSHDLRTPLNAIIGYSSLLRDPRVSENVAKRNEMLERIHQNARIQLNLISDVLDLSRIETGKIAIETEQVDLSELIREILNALEPLGTEKGLVVDFVDNPNRARDPDRSREGETDLHQFDRQRHQVYRTGIDPDPGHSPSFPRGGFRGDQRHRNRNFRGRSPPYLRAVLPGPCF